MTGSGSPRHGDENRQGGIRATTLIVTILASIVVALRLTVRIWVVRSIGWDDYTILCATFGIIIGLPFSTNGSYNSLSAAKPT